MKLRNTAAFLGIGLLLAACAGNRVTVPEAGYGTGFSGTQGTLGGAGGFSTGAAGTGSTLPGTSIGDTVLFAVDSSSLSPSATSILDAQIGWMRQNATSPIRIEGHADERGTGEYNLALGSARASAVRNYMVSQGIPDPRISIITFGRERPVATCADESCFAQNRRAVTVVTGGAGS